MKVGDLVQLSAYGSVRDYNEDLRSPPVCFGLVMAIKYNSAYPFVIMWHNQIKRGHLRRELKYARKTNEAR